ncbi:hypothetical protein LAV44_04615 [Clostridium sporogenes]|uniref:hypothetical protein n=1 Tax=Clostridium sporogenes TaxID=1509 RepID=UPI002237F026|nr:hypothetical protein [Clostridium sporogenes]MCW6074602.1 hypothetical protein [Clostridium sporogenes]
MQTEDFCPGTTAFKVATVQYTWTYILEMLSCRKQCINNRIIHDVSTCNRCCFCKRVKKQK